MSENTGYSNNKNIFCCTECGKIFYSTALIKELCDDCTEKLNELTALEAERRHREQIAKIRKTRMTSGKTVAEITALAGKEGLSYGKYVAKYS